jgi:hypothetical protein
MARYRFKPKRYGYGAAPATWEGWVVMLAVAGILIGSIVAMELLVDRSDFTAWMIWALVIGAVTFRCVRLARERTDGEWRWRWGNRAGTTKI